MNRLISLIFERKFADQSYLRKVGNLVVRSASEAAPAVSEARASSDGRRERLRQLVQHNGFVPLGELADTLGVSESTVRRDLELLEETGDLRRTHGGVFWTGETSTVGAFQDRNGTSWSVKAAVGAAAAALVDEHDTILLDAGSTAYELARQLVGRRLQVVTNSLPVAHLLSSSASIDLITIGGHVRGQTAVAIGPLAEMMLEKINVRIAFLSVAGINERGYFNDNMMLVESERRMLASADRSYVIADHTKFGKASLSHLCALGDVHGVVSDGDLDPTWRDRLTCAGVELILGETKTSNEPLEQRFIS